MTEAQQQAYYTYAAAAKLTAVERDAAALRIDGAPWNKICRALSLSRHEAFRAVKNAQEKLARVAPDFWKPGRDFPRQLVECARNRRIADDTGLSGVTPAHHVLARLPTPPVITADHPALRQTPIECLEHWGRSLAAVS